MTVDVLKMEQFPVLCALMDAYKYDIEEEKLTPEARERLKEAIATGRITFFVAAEENEIVGMCSVCETFSTYNCHKSGVFEDFYIVPHRRRTGLARQMTHAVFEQMRARGVATLWVGSAPCDVKMYESLGFDIPLGQLRCWSGEE